MKIKYSDGSSVGNCCVCNKKVDIEKRFKIFEIIDNSIWVQNVGSQCREANFCYECFNRVAGKNFLGWEK